MLFGFIIKEKNMEGNMVLIDEKSIKDRIYTVRGVQVMLDRDIAQLYGVETRRLNEQVKRNHERFPSEFMFQLNKQEFETWKSHFAISNSDKMGLRRAPFAFTEQGVAMLATVLRSSTAIRASIQIMKAFITMRRLIEDNALVFQRLRDIDLKLLEHDNEIEQLFKLLEQPRQDNAAVFFKGQMWDASSCIEQILEQADSEIILIDSYVDRRTLDMLSRKKTGVSILLFTSSSGNRLTDKEIHDFNAQYPSLEVRITDEFHDRFLILDRERMYHIGASIKDAGKKAFEISRNEDEKLLEAILQRIR